MKHQQSCHQISAYIVFRLGVILCGEGWCTVEISYNELDKDCSLHTSVLCHCTNAPIVWWWVEHLACFSLALAYASKYISLLQLPRKVSILV